MVRAGTKIWPCTASRRNIREGGLREGYRCWKHHSDCREHALLCLHSGAFAGHEALQWQQQSAPQPSGGLLLPPVHVAVLPVSTRQHHAMCRLRKFCLLETWSTLGKRVQGGDGCLTRRFVASSSRALCSLWRSSVIFCRTSSADFLASDSAFNAACSCCTSPALGFPAGHCSQGQVRLHMTRTLLCEATTDFIFQQFDLPVRSSVCRCCSF